MLIQSEQKSEKGSLPQKCARVRVYVCVCVCVRACVAHGNVLIMAKCKYVGEQ